MHGQIKYNEIPKATKWRKHHLTKYGVEELVKFETKFQKKTQEDMI